MFNDYDGDNRLCSFVEVDRRLGGAYCLHYQGDDALITLIMEAVRMSETSVYYETTRCDIPEGSPLETLEYNLVNLFFNDGIQTTYYFSLVNL
jgi:hypothetical protein